ncbi:RDD family protein [Yoonia sp.]|uniref:RDD family protein n=1 Tax=Yoonia sp. TaxID=2212373 RepID=UPI0025ED13F1|nr:RDD family protein [Yoonia sp.]
MRRRETKTAAQYDQDLRARQGKQVLWITPPEGVPIGFACAGLGARIGAQLLDLLVTYGGLIALLALVSYYSGMSQETANALFALFAFLIRIPYYILTELVWNGRTIGKRIAKIRVISINGRRLDPHQVVVRNLMKEAEVFTPIMLLFGVTGSSGWAQVGMFIWLLIVLAIPLFSKQTQRLGDMIAGTCVVLMPRVQRSTELTDQARPVADRFVFLPHHLEQYGRFELQSLESILREKATTQYAHARDIDVARVIGKKIGYTDRVANGDARNFLAAFYNAQRAHLEARQIFGDRRDDKFHRTPQDGTPR